MVWAYTHSQLILIVLPSSHATQPQTQLTRVGLATSYSDPMYVNEVRPDQVVDAGRGILGSSVISDTEATSQKAHFEQIN